MKFLISVNRLYPANKLVHLQKSACYDSFVRFILVNEMAGRQAKVLSESNLAELLAFAESTRQPSRNRLIVLLSAKAGLRAGEIANLTWDMVLGGDGKVGSAIELRDWAAKKGSGRSIPIHPVLAKTLANWAAESHLVGPVIP